MNQKKPLDITIGTNPFDDHIGFSHSKFGRQLYLRNIQRCQTKRFLTLDTMKMAMRIMMHHITGFKAQSILGMSAPIIHTMD